MSQVFDPPFKTSRPHGVRARDTATSEAEPQLAGQRRSLASDSMPSPVTDEREPRMTVCCRKFLSSTKSWDSLVEEAAAFATLKGRDRLINISVSAAGGSDAFGLGAQGAIFVWYWE